MSCALCQNPKNIRVCEYCKKDVCKRCVRFLDKAEIQFHPKPPKILQMRVFCQDCHESLVAPELQEYERVLVAAKETLYLSKNYRGIVPVVRKAKEPITVKRHVDKKEAILHLAFLAALQEFNGIIKGETVAKQIRNHGFETTEWSATGLPVFIDLKKFAHFYED